MRVQQCICSLSGQILAEVLTTSSPVHLGISSLHTPFFMHVTISDPSNKYPGSQLKVTLVPTTLELSEIFITKCWYSLKAGQDGEVAKKTRERTRNKNIIV